MLWRIPADTHVRIGTLLNNFSPVAPPDRLADNESALPDRDSLLSDTDLLGILRKEENAASNYQWSALSQTREDALNYYDREPYGDEQDGASQVVTSEFADVIESIMPGLMRVFTSTDDVAEFTPGAPGEEQWAKEASEYVPHVFMRQNDGFRILYWMIKDALMYRLGAVTVDLDRSGLEVGAVDGAVGPEAHRHRVLVREHEWPVRLQHALHLAEQPGRVLDLGDRVRAERGVDRFGAEEREVGEVALAPLDLHLVALGPLARRADAQAQDISEDGVCKPHLDATAVDAAGDQTLALEGFDGGGFG